MTAQDTAATMIASLRESIAALDEKTLMASVGVAHALTDLRKALVGVEGCLKRRAFEEAAALGYSSVSSGFIFLQRTLGELTSVCRDKNIIVQDVALGLRCSYEEALPHVEAVMEHAQPRPPEAASPS